MSLFNDKLKQITLKEVLLLIIVLFILQYLFNSLNIVHIDSVWIYILIIFYFIFKLRGEVPHIGGDISQALSPEILKMVVFIVVLNIFFSYGMLYLADFILKVSPIHNFFNSFLTVSLFATIFISPISEELIFRGVFLNRLKYIVPPLFAVLISSLLFAALHSYGAIFSAFIFAVCVSIIYLNTDNIFAAIIAHFLNNLFAEIILYMDSGSVLFTNNFVIALMSVLAVVSFVLLLLFIIRQLKILNNDEL